ncbi:UDP-glycosyltransferase 87A1-like isoform X2 [Quercus robur]|uniref:UDP-glycosyltransferase 87A1-like isoform X2 n=1 Tax=Quercus robur TaxID=38942 RepID=UPI0021636632|nr:UDP-glycosyltransferase 87A1-like isoform X2 [Quercus robur]
MNSVKVKPTTQCHVVAMPYPGRGHINPMMNLCKILASKKKDILITFVVTEEWLSFIGSDPKPDNVRFSTIPNVIPSELVRAADIFSFFEATMTKLEAPFVQLLDQLELPVTVIMADTVLSWVVGVGNRRNIPVASLWTMSPSMLSTTIQRFQADFISEAEERVVDTAHDQRVQQMSQRFFEACSCVTKAQYLLLASIYELESETIDVLKSQFSFPVYAVGPTIPLLDLEENMNPGNQNYLNWLDCQPRSSVLYISMGSFLSISSAQMDEIAIGLHDSGVRFLWVARDETCRLNEVCGDMGLVVPWCDQLKVLSHSSIGGFWSHCGWNSTKEGMFYGIPFLTYPIGFDQIHNSKLIVEDWKIGWRVKKDVGADNLVTGAEIAKLVTKFMDLESDEMKEIRSKASEVQHICQRAIVKGGSCESSINAFIKDLSNCDGY